MKVLDLDNDKCIACAACVEDCPAHLFTKPPTEVGDKRKILFSDPNDRCILCGHCISICPTDAIIYESPEKAYEFEEAKDPSTIINYEGMLKALRIRRSIRKFKDKSVPKEDIEAVLEAMRYAPSGMNAQAWEYIVITDPQKIATLRKAVEKLMFKLRPLLKFAKKIKFLLPKAMKEMVSEPKTEMGLNEFIARTEAGEDRVFYNAPVILITYTPPSLDHSMSAADAGIALTYGMLAAQARSLGTCWIGYAQITLARSKKLKKLFGIPKKYLINGVLIMGYPGMKYHRTPPREPLKVKWF